MIGALDFTCNYTYFGVMANVLSSADFYAACVCLGLNRAARVTARRYDAVLKPLGITSGQFSILSSLLRDTPVTVGKLADLLGMERTTLQRNLLPLETAGLVQVHPDEKDRRVRRVTSTRTGRDLLSKAVPLWRNAQRESDHRIGSTSWAELRTTLDRLATG